MAAGVLPLSAVAQMDFDREPVHYSTATRTDPIARLQKRLEDGEAKLEYDTKNGYLPALLRALGISEKSQVLVFSKTSFQRERISPQWPRALYFSDDMYIGWVHGGDVIEITGVDPNLGAVFYTLDQRKVDKPTFALQLDSCTQCHASSMTEGVPGHLVRSVYADERGHAILSAGSFRTTYQSPLRERWGGWYVTGTHGQQQHMGNTLFTEPVAVDKLDLAPGANVTDLHNRVDLKPYLTPHSDIVALMVLEHQTVVHNRLTAANYQARRALLEQEVLNKMMNNPSGERSPGIQRRLERAGDEVLECLLFAGEAPLADPIAGTSGFAEYYAGLGPRDKQGRSLRDFDLQTRLFKYPCSYLIYSDAFAALPDPVKQHVYRRLRTILTGQATDAKFAHLSGMDREAICGILLETHAGLSASWNRP